MSRRVLVLLALLAAPALAQPFLRHCFGTIAQLPAVAASAPGRLCTVSNGASATDCTVGGGSTSVLCRDNGSAWVAVGGGSGGGSATVESVALTMPSIFSVSGSPITTTGTLAVALANQSANTVQAGPTTGAAAAPTFRALVAADIPTPLTSSTSGNAGTATALAANGANCSAGSAPRGVDASGAAEDCTAYLTDITGQSIGDLNDVDETGAATGEALVSDGAGAWSPSAAAVCLSNGTNCPASSSAFSAITSGTNTTAAMVVGSGSHLATIGSGTIAATTSAALAANPANCSAGQAPRGVDAAGAVENCTTYLTAVTPGGSDNQIQVNESGALAGDSDFTYDTAAVDAATKFSVIGSLATTKVDGYGRLLVDQAATCPSTFGGMCVSWSGTVLARFGANLGISTDKADSSGTGKFLFATTTEVGLSNYNGPVILNPATSGTHQETSFLANGVMRLPAIATAPATCTAYRDFYVDTSGAFCWCSATNTWTVFTGAGACT